MEPRVPCSQTNDSNCSWKVKMAVDGGTGVQLIGRLEQKWKMRWKERDTVKGNIKL